MLLPLVMLSLIAWRDVGYTHEVPPRQGLFLSPGYFRLAAQGIAQKIRK
jgi:hypothetical protein